MTDTLQPNVLTVTPDGTIGADFTGKVTATGLTIPASTTKGVTDEIQWIRESDGAAVADIYGQSPIAGETDLILEAQPVDSATKLVQMVLAAAGANSRIGFGFAPGAVGGTLMDAGGRSSFLQLLSTQQLQLAFGLHTVTWPGGSTFSNLDTINHGLGRLPQIVASGDTGVGAGLTHNAVATTTNWTSTTFQMNAEQATVAPGAGATRQLWWLALG